MTCTFSPNGRKVPRPPNQGGPLSAKTGIHQTSQELRTGRPQASEVRELRQTSWATPAPSVRITP